MFFQKVVKLILVFFFLVTGFNFQSCSRPKAGQVDYEKFTVPEFQTESFPINLTEDQSVKRFSGSVMVWNNSLTREAAYQFMSVSKKSVDVEVDRLRYIRDVMIPTAKKLEDAKLRKEDLINQGSLSLRKQSLDQALSFKDQTLIRLNEVATLSDDSLKYFNTAFGLYCDALLFNRAANPQYLAISYRKRPIWSGVCEAHYAASGLMQTEASVCQDQTKGSNYFSCIWSEGVLKSQLFKSLYSQDLQTKVASISPELIASKFNFAKQGLNNFLSLLKAYKLRNEAGDQVDEIPAPDLKQGEDEYALLRKIRGSKSVFILMSDYERGKIPTLDFSTQEFSQAQIASIDTITEVFRKVIAGNSDRSGALRSSEQLYNDYFLAQDTSKEESRSIERVPVKAYEELVQIAPIMFNPIYDVNIKLKMEEEDQQLNTLIDEGRKILSQLNPGAKCQVESALESSFIGCRTESVVKEQLEVASRKEISDALFNGVQFRVERDQNDSRENVRVFSFSFNKSSQSSISICYDTQSNQMVDCIGGKIQDSYVVKSFEVEPSTGKVHLVVQVIKSQDLGLGYKVRELNAVAFNEINFNPVSVQGDDLNQMYMDLEMFPNRLESMQDIYTGSVKLKRNPDDETYLSYGNISLRDENPSFNEIKSKFESTVESGNQF